jgi:hypothetical protein
MKKANSRATWTLFFAAALCCSAISLAQSPFDGTWRTDLGSTKFSPKPINFYISQGWYHCDSCNPAITAKADGTDQAVIGQPYDTTAITIVDPNSITVVSKKAGKVISEQTRSVSSNGKTLTVKITDHPMNSDKPETFEGIAKRQGMLPADVHATSGDWILQKESGSDNGVTSTFKSNGDELTMTAPDGVTYTAKLDGADYPVKGSYGWDTVALKKIDAHTFEETDKRNGTVTDVSKITINGKTMTVVDEDKLTGRTETFVSHKQ